MPMMVWRLTKTKAAPLAIRTMASQARKANGESGALRERGSPADLHRRVGLSRGENSAEWGVISETRVYPGGQTPDSTKKNSNTF